ncbi:hypothetical protein [Patulibacter sp.]|uniref:hypothetical protein n=1 Tax=Patulibacter sp. TaxID=1912859 RepID=UPI002723518E|nr:hypothetical protein [Patulibacter sp.]MDO9410931.1 hypothetical protein [Patulibacter sp.]
MSTAEQQSPLPVGITLDRGFALLRRHPRALLLPQLVLQIVPLLAAGVLVLVGLLLIGDVATTREVVRESTFLGDSELRTREVSDFTDGQAVTLGILIFVGAIVYLWFFLASVISVVRGADRALEGKEHLKLRPAMRDALRETPKLFGIGIVFYLLATVAVLAVVAVVALVAVAAGALAVLVGLAGLVVLVWASVRVFLWPFAHLSEHTGLGSFRRAWTLSKGRFWSLFGVLVLVTIVVSVVYFVVSFVLQLLVVGAASLGDAVGVAAVVPYVLFSTVFSVVFTAGYIAPLAVAYRTLSGRDTAELWQAAQQMQAGGAGAPDLAPPAPEPGVRRWDASEAPLDGSDGRSSASEGPGTAGSSAPGLGGFAAGAGSTDGGPRDGVGGLPAPDEPSEAERRWGRGGDEPPAG